MPSSVVTTIQEHTLPLPKGLRVVRSVLDVGAGIRPMQWYKPAWHVCVEPHPPYAVILEKAGYAVWCKTALTVLAGLAGDGAWVDAVYLLDVIEHMQKEEARKVLQLAQEAARYQVLVYTPVGFVEQTEDAWGLGGKYWQTHRSGWSPVEFPSTKGWETELFFPPQPKRNQPPEGFYALWNKA